LPAVSFASDVKLTNIKITQDQKNLLVSLKVKGAFNKNMDEAILNGVPATFSFFIILYKKRSVWADKYIGELNVNQTLKYHNLKNHYIVKRSWEGNKPHVTESFEEAKQMMAEIYELEFMPLKKLKKGRRYEVLAKAELDRVTLPFFLDYILFFASLWDFETDWHSHEFVYAPAKKGLRLK